MDEIRTFLASDMRLFDAAAARIYRMNVEEYNQFVIDKINQTLNDNDCLLMNGVISKGSLITTLIELAKIKGKKIFLTKEKLIGEDIKSYQKNNTFIWTLDGTQVTTILDKEALIVIPANEKRLEEYLSESNVYLAMPASMFPKDWKRTNVYDYDKHVLNTSLEFYDFEPIEMGSRLREIIDDYEVFNTMETTEHQWEEK